MSNPKILRGEIWLINLDPTIGAEIQKIRPGVVLSSDALGILPLRLAAPITSWQDRFSSNIWHVKLDSTKVSGLNKPSVADLLQIRSLDQRRFLKKLGRVTDEELREMNLALLNVIDFEP